MSHANIISVRRHEEKRKKLILIEKRRGVDSLTYLAQRSEHGELSNTAVKLKASEKSEI
jgi:hypothetical protein